MAMYPLGKGGIYPICDALGNVWEWQANFADREKRLMALRGGSFKEEAKNVNCNNRLMKSPFETSIDIGFRVVISQIY